MHQDTLLRLAYAEGWRTADIARVLRTTRSAVTGCAWRLGLAHAKPREDDLGFPPAATALARLARRQCRRPMGDPREEGFRFCGAAVRAPGESYCAPCHAETHLPLARPRRIIGSLGYTFGGG